VSVSSENPQKLPSLMQDVYFVIKLFERFVQANHALMKNDVISNGMVLMLTEFVLEHFKVLIC
jgi:hypothetical protein